VPESSLVKYHVKIRFEVDGVVEKADLIGAIFGQTEGLFGPEMNLNELQKNWKVGRIEVKLNSRNGRTFGEVLIPMSTDISTAALIAAAIESIDKVGPCSVQFKLAEIEDVRASKRRVIVERAKEIAKEWASKTSSAGEEILKDVMESIKPAKLITFGKENLPAGPGVYTSDTVILVEGRADVINLLRTGIENVVAIEGTKVPESIIRLSKEKRIVAFLDGDRGGDLILKELQQVADLERVVRAPRGREVEDLTPIEIIELLRPTAIPRVSEEVEVKMPQPVLSKVSELYPKINGTLEAVILDGKMNQITQIPVNELMERLASSENAKAVVFDGIITQRLVDASRKVGVETLVGHRIGDVARKPEDITLATFKELGLD